MEAARPTPTTHARHSGRAGRGIRIFPSFFRLQPWPGAGCAVMLAILLAGLVLLVGLRADRHEADLTQRVMEEKGTSLIGTLEGALRTGMGFHWTDAEIQDLLEKTAAQPDILHVAITDAAGRVLASSTDALVGADYLNAEELHALAPGSSAQAGLLRRNNGDCFLVYRKLEVPRFEERMEHYNRGHGMSPRRQQVREAERKYTGQPLLVFAAYDVASLHRARDADALHFYAAGAVAVFLCIAGALTLLLVQGYRQSRRLMQEARAYSAHIVRTLPVGVVTTDTAGRVTTINPEARRILGSEADAVRGKPLATLLPELPGLPPNHLYSHHNALPERELRCDIGGKKGVPLAASASPIVTGQGHVIGYAYILRDLGEIRHLQAELRHSERLAALGNMAAGIAHEIRNPLGAIKGLARFCLVSSPSGSEEHRVAGIMAHEVTRLDKVVSDLLDFARPDMLHLEPVPLDTLAHRVERLLAPELKAQGVTFAVHLPQPAPVLRLDADRMTQVLLNLCCNSLQAMPQGGRITWRYAEEPDAAVLEVRDTGQGMPEAVLRQAFSPYFTTRPEGTGLGLSIVHKLMEAHEGSVEITSTEGQGTRVLLRFPLRGATVSPADTNSTEHA